jgi:hypothetical protein
MSVVLRMMMGANEKKILKAVFSSRFALVIPEYARKDFFHLGVY